MYKVDEPVWAGRAVLNCPDDRNISFNLVYFCNVFVPEWTIGTDSKSVKDGGSNPSEDTILNPS